MSGASASEADQPAPGYDYTPQQAQTLRVAYVEAEVAPVVRQVFADHPHLRSALLCIAQFFNDQAHDQVHSLVVFSEVGRAGPRARSRLPPGPPRLG